MCLTPTRASWGSRKARYTERWLGHMRTCSAADCAKRSLSPIRVCDRISTILATSYVTLGSRWLRLYLAVLHAATAHAVPPPPGSIELAKVGRVGALPPVRKVDCTPRNFRLGNWATRLAVRGTGASSVIQFAQPGRARATGRLNLTVAACPPRRCRARRRLASFTPTRTQQPHARPGFCLHAHRQQHHGSRLGECRERFATTA